MRAASRRARSSPARSTRESNAIGNASRSKQRPARLLPSRSTCTRELAAPSPGAMDWIASPSPDCLLARDPGPADSVSGNRRFLWLRVDVLSTDGRANPTLRRCTRRRSAQLPRRAAAHLPPRRSGPRFLERWLALFRSGFEDREQGARRAARDFDPIMAPADRLASRRALWRSSCRARSRRRSCARCSRACRSCTARAARSAGWPTWPR